jgi:hypothetical protein
MKYEGREQGNEGGFEIKCTCPYGYMVKDQVRVTSRRGHA